MGTYIRQYFGKFPRSLHRDIITALTAQAETLAQIKTSIDLLIRGVNMLTINTADLVASTAKNTTVIGSALNVINGFSAQLGAISAQLAAALAANDPVALAAVQTTIDQSKAAIDASDTDLAAAIAANTPAATPPLA
jgi:hypothetical protein